MTDFEQDQREANRILREWITDKTGTTDTERAMFKLTCTWWLIREKMRDPIAQFMDTLVLAAHIRDHTTEEPKSDR